MGTHRRNKGSQRRTNSENKEKVIKNKERQNEQKEREKTERQRSGGTYKNIFLVRKANRSRAMKLAETGRQREH
jgi:hypothetical protein